MGETLGDRFARLISDSGPIPVARFMGESNAHYYATRDPLGAPGGAGGGDFVTAPEISQMFGELAGLWLADLWQRAGRPEGAIYAELGPGRGTLAKDALRALAGAGCRPLVHLVEGSPALRKVQVAAVPGAHFHDDAAALPTGHPLLLIANEFLDALPIRQLVRAADGWRERMVGLRDGALAFIAGPVVLDPLLPALPADAPEDTIVEVNPGAAAVVGEIADRIARDGGAALFVDYGHLAPRTGSTLQAVRAHQKIGALDAPGEADLSAHVDFAALAAIARRAGCRVSLTTQGDWLTEMGIDLRAAALSGRKPSRADEIAMARDRLVQPGEMGQLFKMMGIVAPGWPEAAGFG